MGSFTALADIIESDANSNTIVADHTELLDCRNSVVVTEEKDHLIAMVGVENMIVAHTEDATLVCPIDQADQIKELLEHIRSHQKAQFL